MPKPYGLRDWEGKQGFRSIWRSLNDQAKASENRRLYISYGKQIGLSTRRLLKIRRNGMISDEMVRKVVSLV